MNNPHKDYPETPERYGHWFEQNEVFFVLEPASVRANRIAMVLLICLAFTLGFFTAVVWAKQLHDAEIERRV